MNPVRFAIIGVALVAAIGLALLLRNILAPKGPPRVVVAAAPQAPSVRVLVAAHDLKVGDRLHEIDMTWQGWPADALNPSYITDTGATPAATPQPTRLIKSAGQAARDVVTGGGPKMQALDGAVVRQAMNKGEPIIQANVVRAGQGGFMSVVLDPGTRAMTVSVNADSGVAGFIQPGDRTDLVQAVGDPSKGGSTQTILSNVRVLAVDQTTTPAANGKTITGSTITLEVPSKLVEMVAEAKARGGLSMALRSYADTGGPTGTGEGGSSHGIRLFKAGQVVQVMVSQ
jgi:pilus assembly protein CpaB